MHHKHTASSLRSQYLGDATRASASSPEVTISARGPACRSQRASRAGNHMVSRDRHISSPVLIEALHRQESVHQPVSAAPSLYCETIFGVVGGSSAQEQTPSSYAEEPAIVSAPRDSDSGSAAPAFTSSNRDSTISYAQNDRGTISKRLEAALCVANPSEIDWYLTALPTTFNRNSTMEYAQTDRGMISSKLRTHLQVANPTIDPAPKTPPHRDSPASYVYTDRDYIHQSVYRHLVVINQSYDSICDESTQEDIAAHAQDKEELALLPPLPYSMRVSQFGPESSTQLHLEREQMDNDREDFITGARGLRILYRSASRMFLGKLTDGLEKVRCQLETSRGRVDYDHAVLSS